MEARFAALKTAQEIRDLKGHAFEEYLRQLFRDLGYQVKKTPPSRDGGADLIIEKNGKRVAVQAKSYKNAVGYDAVKEIYAGRTIYGAEYACVVTTSHFTSDAKRRARQLNVDLFDGEALERLAAKARSRSDKQNDAIRIDTPNPIGMPVSDKTPIFRNTHTVSHSEGTSPGSDQIHPKIPSSSVESSSRIRMRRPNSWERIRRIIDYSYSLPNCWLPGLNKVERSRWLLLALAAILLAAPGGSMTLGAIRCQLPSSVNEEELKYILHSIPLYKVEKDASKGACDTVAHYAVDSKFVAERYEATYKKLDEAMVQLIRAIEGLPQGLLAFSNEQIMVPSGYAHAKYLDRAILQKAIALGYIVQFAEPRRMVCIPAPTKDLLSYENETRVKPLEPEEAKKLTYDAFAEAERLYAAISVWDLALQFHQEVAMKFEQYCLNKEGPLGFCYRALYESGGGLTDIELTEYVAKMQGSVCTAESIAFLRKNCLESDSLISCVKMFCNGGWGIRYFLAFQKGIDDSFLLDYVARTQMLQAQIASLSSQIDALSRQRNDTLEGLAKQRVQLANALGTKTYSSRKEKRSMRESLSFVEQKIDETWKSDANMRQRTFAALSEELARKQVELNQMLPRCDSEKWRFKLS